MDNEKTDFFIQTALLDKYINTNPSLDPIASGVILKRLKLSEDLLRYFFSQNPSPDWAEMLYDNGFFDKPPQVEIVENGYRTPYWPQSRYLKDIAKFKPDIVVKAISNISTNNPTIHTDFVDALLQIPADMSVNLIGAVKNWLNNEYLSPWMLMPEATSKLIVYYVESNKKSEAFELFDELIRPIAINSIEQNKFRPFGKVMPRFDMTYLHPDFWTERIPTIEKSNHKEVIEILLRNFILTLKFELPENNPTESDINWVTSRWRSSVGDTSQDKTTAYKDRLLTALRDSLSRCVKNDVNVGKDFIIWMLKQDLAILVRIGIYVTAINAGLLQDLACKIMVNGEMLHDIDYHNEYFELLKQGYPVISKSEKESVFKLILQGPLPETVEKITALASSNYGENIDEYKKRYINTWIRDRLWMIRQYLDIEKLAILNDLTENYGEPKHPEFLSYISEVQTITEEGPLSVEEIFSYEPVELIDFLKTWEPSDGVNLAPIEISHRGFAQAIAIAFFQKPKYFSFILRSFADLQSVYISAIFAAAQEMLKDEQDIPWEELIILVEVVVDQSIKSRESVEENRKSINGRLGAVWFLRNALQSKNFPINYLDKIEKALIVFARDMDPDERKEYPPEGYLGYNDPLTLSLNSVRPLALDALLYLIDLSDDDVSKESLQKNKLVRLNNLKSILDEKLDKRQESSWAVYSILGKWFPYLYFLDTSWALNIIPDIFPEKIELERYFLAAWGSYILTKPNPEILRTLKSKYGRAIHNLSQGKMPASSMIFENHFANHILLDYLWKQEYDLLSSSDDNLLALFFSVCDEEMRGKAIWTLWRLIESMTDVDKTVYWPKVKRIWKWRTNELVLSGYSNEFQREFEWFSYILLEVPENETMSKLQSFLDPIIPFANETLVWKNLEKYLSKQVDTNPEQTIKIYRQMYDRVKIPKYGSFSYGKESDKIIETAIKNPKSKKDTLALINQIGRFDQRYRKLYEENT